MKTYHSSYDSGVVGSRAQNMGWLVEFTYNASSTLYFATYDCNLTGAGAAVGNVLSVDGISSSIDLESAEWSHTRVVITLADANILGYATTSLTNKTLSGLIAQKQFKGRAVSVWRINSSLTTVTGHDKEFKGYVSEVQMSIDGSSYSFICDSWPEKSRKVLPATIVNETDYPLAPKESLGQPLPIVYGTFENEADGSDERDMRINNFHYVPSVCIDASVAKFAFASHEVNSLANTDISIYENNIKNYLCGVYAYTGSTVRPTVSTSAPANVLLTSPTSLKYWAADSVYLIPPVKGGHDSGNTTSRQYLYSQSLHDGYAVLTSGAAGLPDYCTQKFLSLGGQLEFTNAPATTALTLWIYVVSTTGTPNYKLAVYNGITVGSDSTGFLSTTTGWKSFDFGNCIVRSEIDGTAITATDKWTIEELIRYEFDVQVDTASDVVNIAAMCIELKVPIISIADVIVYRKGGDGRHRRRGRRDSQNGYDPLAPNPYIKTVIQNSEEITDSISHSAVFAEIKGREFGSWIDDVARSNSKNAGDLINDSSFQIESLLRDELGFADADITVSEFDAVAAGGRSNTHFSVSQFVDSYRLIRELSQATFTVTFPSSGGKWRHVEIPSDPEGDATYSMAIDWQDIKPLSYYETPLDNLCNKITLRYHLDYGSGQYRKEYIVSNSTSQGTGVTGYNHTFEKVISVPFFRFDSSSGATNYAQEFATSYVSNWKDPHPVFEFEMLNHSKFELEEGDVVIFDNFERNIGGLGSAGAGDYWATVYSPASIYWMVVKREPFLDVVSYTVVNLLQLV